MELTDNKIKNAKKKDKDYRLADGHGLHVLVKSNGSKLWHWKYRFQGKQKIMSFGVYPEVGIAAAHDLYEAARKVLKSGVDPISEKKASRAQEKVQSAALATSIPGVVNPFREAAMQWYDWWKTGKDEGYADDVKKRMETDILPALGDIAIADITPERVVQMVVKIEERGAEDVARRALQTVGQIFRRARALGLAQHNPAGAFKPRDVLKPMPREHFKRVSEVELPGLLRAMHFYDGRRMTRLGLKLMALTFLRTSEMIEALWSDINWKTSLWTIPKERMKGPEGEKWPHIVPIARQTKEVLLELWQCRQNERWIFPGEQGAAHMSNNTLLYALYDLGYKGEMTGHGFRGVASTYLHGKGYDYDHVEIQLAHGPKDDVAAAYNWARYVPERTVMMQDWADYLDQLLAKALEQSMHSQNPRQVEQTVPE